MAQHLVVLFSTIHQIDTLDPAFEYPTRLSIIKLRAPQVTHSEVKLSHRARQNPTVEFFRLLGVPASQWTGVRSPDYNSREVQWLVCLSLCQSYGLGPDASKRNFYCCHDVPNTVWRIGTLEATKPSCGIGSPLFRPDSRVRPRVHLHNGL